MPKTGYTASRRLLDAGCISHDPVAGAAALEMLTSPVISTTCTRIPGMRFPDPRVQALLGACCALARISAPVLRPLGQANSKWSSRPAHQGTVVSAGRSASRRTGE